MGERPPSISPEIWQELQESKEAAKAKAAAGNGASEGSAPPKRAHPPGFRMASNGLLWTDPSDDGKPEIVVSGCFEIVAESRDDAGGNWGILLRWKDPDGRSKDWAMPRSLLAGDGLEVRRVLLDGGLYIGASAKARTLLTTYFASMHVAARLRAVTSTGWFGSTFILPDGQAAPQEAIESADLTGATAHTNSNTREDCGYPLLKLQDVFDNAVRELAFRACV
jgi:putative DNA primase/helicase